MIKVLSCNNKNYKKNLINFLDKRRQIEGDNTIKVSKILSDIKKIN